MSRIPIAKAAAAEAGFWTKKGLGQHLLRDPSVADQIVKALEPAGADMILEIGPGLGALTERLLELGPMVLGVECDPKACAVLRSRFGSLGRFRLVEADILKADLDGLVAGSRSLRVAANLPYYITTPVLARLLEERLPFTRLVALTQWEVGLRLAAPPGGKDRAAISVLAQYHCEVELLRKVYPGAFTPPPKVDSALVLFKRRLAPAAIVRNERLFFKLVRACFEKRRKTLKNGLKMWGLDRAAETLARAGLDPMRRPETLSIEEFGRLCDACAASSVS